MNATHADPKRDVYSIVTDQIITALEKGTIPWRQTWRDGMPANLATRKSYRGLNALVLWITQIDAGYNSSFWLTYKQARDLGGHVRKGEHGVAVVFWKWIANTYEIEYAEDDVVEEDLPTEEQRAIARYYTVFNLDQCEGIEAPAQADNPAIASAEDVVSGYQSGPAIFHDSGKAFYRPSTDEVHTPPRRAFESSDTFYATLFHELAHSTGNESRLGRFASEGVNHRFGSEDYSKEELVAELGSAMLCAVSNISSERTIENAAAYIQNWLEALRNDRAMLVHAAQAAQKAADFILG